MKDLVNKVFAAELVSAWLNVSLAQLSLAPIKFSQVIAAAKDMFKHEKLNWDIITDKKVQQHMNHILSDIGLMAKFETYGEGKISTIKLSLIEATNLSSPGH